MAHSTPAPGTAPAMRKSVSEPALEPTNNLDSSFISVTRFSRQVSHEKKGMSKSDGFRPASSAWDKKGMPKGASGASGVPELTKADVLRRELPRIAPELPKLRHGRFTSGERMCFRRYPYPSDHCAQKAENFWRTTGCLRMAMSESGLHMIPSSKGDFWSSPDFSQNLRLKDTGTTGDPLRRRGAVFAGTETAGQANILPAEGPTAKILDEIFPTNPPSRGSTAPSGPLTIPNAQERLKVVTAAAQAHKDHKESQKPPTVSHKVSHQSNTQGQTGSLERERLKAADLTADERKKSMQEFRLKILDKYSTIAEAFDSLDCDASKELTSKEWNNTLYNSGLASYREARQLFELVDADKSGTITISEFYVAIEAVTPIHTIEDLRKRLLAAGFRSMLSAIAAMDNNGEIADKRLGFAEFAKILQTVVQTDEEENAAVFLSVRDTNTVDNTVSISELATALAVVSPCLLIEDLRDRLLTKFTTLHVAWDKIDIDKSGDVNSFEFMRQGKKNLGLSLIEAQKMFRWIDNDSSGVISRSEFMGAVNLSSSSLQLEDFRRKVRQRFRSIEAVFLEAFAVNDGGLLDNTLQLNIGEFTQLLENIEVTPKDTKRLFDLVDADKSGTLTLREFFRGIEVFAPSCLLEGIQLQILRRQKNGLPSDAFKQVPFGRNERLDLVAFRTFLEDHKLIKGVKVGPLFDLVDVRSDGGVTLGELIAALQCVQPGTMVKLSPEERDLQVKLRVRGDLAAFHKNVAETKLQIRAGLTGRTPEDRRRPKQTEAEGEDDHVEAGEMMKAAGGGHELIAADSRFATVAQQSFAKLHKHMGVINQNKSDSDKSLVIGLRTYFGGANRMLNAHAPLMQKNYSRHKLHETTEAHKNIIGYTIRRA